MGMEDFKRWHWIVIGLVLGLGLSYAWTGVESEVGRNNVLEFVRDVQLPVDPKLGPVVRKILVLPPEPDFRAQAAMDSAGRKESIARSAELDADNPPADVSGAQRAQFIAKKREEAKTARAEAEELRKSSTQHRINVVKYQRLMQTRDGKSRYWVDQQFIAEIPFRVATRGGGSMLPEGATVQSYLDAVTKDNPAVKYRNAWWATKPMQFAIWTSASVLAIGILWPNVLNGLVGAGYGRKHEPKKKRDSLWAYKSHSTRAPAPVVAKIRPEDDQRLIAMTDKLERDLAAVATEHGGSAAVSASAGAEVRRLDGGPLEVAQAGNKPDDDDEIEIKGEYYPVLIHHKKSHENEQPAGDSKPD
jgi:hypothetical protein